MIISTTIRFLLDDPSIGRTRLFTKNIAANVPRVPAVGEAVEIPGANATTSLGARRVEEVIYPLDGTVILDFRADGLANDATRQAEQLRLAGFVERAPVAET